MKVMKMKLPEMGAGFIERSLNKNTLHSCKAPLFVQSAARGSPWRTTVTNPIFISEKHYFHQSNY